MATRFLPMSWRSPLTVPITTTPRGLTPALARWGSSLASPAFMARAATRTSGMKTSLALNWTPRRSMPGIRPSFKMVPAGVPAARARSTSASTSAFFPAIRASCISLSISSLLPKKARPAGPLSENERKAQGGLDHGVPDRAGRRGRFEDVQEPRLVTDVEDEAHPSARLRDRPRGLDGQPEVRAPIAVRDVAGESERLPRRKIGPEPLPGLAEHGDDGPSPDLEASPPVLDEDREVDVGQGQLGGGRIGEGGVEGRIAGRPERDPGDAVGRERADL